LIGALYNQLNYFPLRS